jgi:hypothetical protein
MNCHEAEGLEGGEESGAAGDDGHDDGKSSSGNGSGTERCTVPPRGLCGVGREAGHRVGASGCGGQRCRDLSAAVCVLAHSRGGDTDSLCAAKATTSSFCDTAGADENVLGGCVGACSTDQLATRGLCAAACVTCPYIGGSDSTPGGGELNSCAYNGTACAEVHSVGGRVGCSDGDVPISGGLYSMFCRTAHCVGKCDGSSSGDTHVSGGFYGTGCQVAHGVGGCEGGSGCAEIISSRSNSMTGWAAQGVRGSNSHYGIVCRAAHRAGGRDGGSGCDKQVSGRLYGIRGVAHRVVARDVGSGGDMPISGGLYGMVCQAVHSVGGRDGCSGGDELISGGLCSIVCRAAHRVGGRDRGSGSDQMTSCGFFGNVHRAAQSARGGESVSQLTSEGGLLGVPAGSSDLYYCATTSLGKTCRSVDLCGGEWADGGDPEAEVGKGSGASAVAASDAGVGDSDVGDGGDLEAGFFGGAWVRTLNSARGSVAASGATRKSVIVTAPSRRHAATPTSPSGPTAFGSERIGDSLLLDEWVSDRLLVFTCGATAVHNPVNRWVAAPESVGPAAADFGSGRADSDGAQNFLKMENGQKPRFADCAFALLAIFLILVVGLYCLPLVLPDRVLKVCIMRRPSIVKRYYASTQYQKPCASFLQNLDSFFDRVHLYCNWLLAWLVIGSGCSVISSVIWLALAGRDQCCPRPAVLGPRSRAAAGSVLRGDGEVVSFSGVGMSNIWQRICATCCHGYCTVQVLRRALGPGSPARQGARNE